MTPELWWQEGVPPVSIRLHPQKGEALSKYGEEVPWCPTGRYLPERPVFTLDPHFHAGAYYVQEASSMFLTSLAHLFKEQKIRRVLDLCAAPGGKSTLLAELLDPDGFLVANEVIKSRVGVLAQNMAKWGYAHVAVTNNDAKDFSRLPHCFDAILADLPCSGEGMFRKDPQAMQAWSPDAVRLCADRQRRIVADVWEALRPGGYLIYSTCTFNRLENEENVSWICDSLGASICPVPVHPDWGILEQEGCYRFLPYRLRGEGLFFALLQKHDRDNPFLRKPSRTNRRAEQQGPVGWLDASCGLFAKGDLIKALPVDWAPEVGTWEALLRVVQSGVAVARFKGKEWIPQADLAFAPILRIDAFPVVEVDLSVALRYLAKESFALPGAPIGYIMIAYQGNRLGFAKNLGSRINNLYPSSSRIRMGI